MTVTQRDVRRLTEAQDFAQRVAKEAEALRWRLREGSAARAKAGAASRAAAELDGCLDALREQLERTEDVRL